MSEQKYKEHSNPRPAVAPPRMRPKRFRPRAWIPALIWLIPIVAVWVGFSLIERELRGKGPIITLVFLSAEGLEAGKTPVKYKSVEIGKVQAITLNEDRSKVLVRVQLVKSAESFTAADTRFWVVRPRVAFGGVSGLDTLFSGTYIGIDGGTSTATKTTFNGLETPPIITRDSSGHQYTLHTADLGSLDIGSPIYYRRIKVGQIVAFNLDNDGKSVTLRIFINRPYDKFVGINTRFWHASGFNMQLDTNGLKFNTQSLASAILGGIAFQAPEDEENGPAALENTSFELAEDQNKAMKELDGESQTMVLYFKQSLRGLSPGAAVDFRGVVVGEVTSIGIHYDVKQHEFLMPVVVHVYPKRLAHTFGDTNQVKPTDAHMQRLQSFINHGLRAQLRTGNLLTNQLYVAIDFFPNTPKVVVDANKNPLELPTLPSNLDQLQTQVADIAGRLSKVPFDKLGSDLQKVLKNLNSTLTSAEQLTRRLNNDVAPGISAAMIDARKTLNAAEHTLADRSPLQQDIRQTLQELSRTATSVRILTDYLEQHPEALIRGKPQEQQKETQ